MPDWKDLPLPKMKEKDGKEIIDEEGMQNEEVEGQEKLDEWLDSNETKTQSVEESKDKN